MIMGKNMLRFLVFLMLAASPALAESGKPAVKAPEALEAAAEPAGNRSSSGLPIPRFVSLASNEVRVRTGPSLRYPIRWIYRRDHLPVEVIQEFDTWRKVRDAEGDSGWVHQSMVSGERYALVKGEANLGVRKEAEPAGGVIAYLEPGVMAAVSACKGDWCRISSSGYDGWAERKFLWGIYDSEEFD